MKIIKDQLIYNLGEIKILLKEKENEAPDEKNVRLKKAENLVKSCLYLTSQL